MPSTVYKGDLTEVSFGHETGLTIPHGVAGDVKFIAKTGTRDLTADTSIIKFEGVQPQRPSLMMAEEVGLTILLECLLVQL